MPCRPGSEAGEYIMERRVGGRAVLLCHTGRPYAFNGSSMCSLFSHYRCAACRHRPGPALPTRRRTTAAMLSPTTGLVPLAQTGLVEAETQGAQGWRAGTAGCVRSAHRRRPRLRSPSNAITTMSACQGVMAADHDIVRGIKLLSLMISMHHGTGSAC